MMGHIYLGTLGMDGALKSMTTGYVDETWAKEHHELWYDDIVAGKIPAQRTPERDAPYARRIIREPAVRELSRDWPQAWGAPVIDGDGWHLTVDGRAMTLDDLRALGETEVTAVLDWEMLSVAPREMDLGWWLFIFRYYSEGIGVPALEGFGGREEFLELYERAAGRGIWDPSTNRARTPGAPAVSGCASNSRAASSRLGHSTMSFPPGFKMRRVCCSAF